MHYLAEGLYPIKTLRLSQVDAVANAEGLS